MSLSRTLILVSACLALLACGSKAPPESRSPNDSDEPAHAVEAPARAVAPASSVNPEAPSAPVAAETIPQDSPAMTPPDSDAPKLAVTPSASASKLELRVVSTRGGLGKDAIQEVLELASQAFAECATAIPYGGKASVRFAVGRRGVATQLRVQGAPKEAQRCLSQAIARVVFPEDKRTTKVQLDIKRKRRLPTITHHRPTPKSTTTIRALLTRGQRPSFVIRRILRMYRGRFAPCYEQHLFANPGYVADVQVRFSVKPDGSIQGLVVQSPNYALRSCITTLMRTLNFSAMPHTADTTVSFTYEFRPPPILVNPPKTP